MNTAKRTAPLLFCISLVIVPVSAFSQGAPALLWSTNVGGRVIAVDSQTNVYAQAGGSVIVLSGAGVPIQTNLLSTNAGVAARDASGNYYYAGTYPPTSGPPYGVNYKQQFFLTRYSSAGAPVWTVENGSAESIIRSASVTDLQVEPLSGAVYVGFFWTVSSSTHDTLVVRYDSDGSNSWSSSVPVPPSGGAGGPVKVGALPQRTVGPSMSWEVRSKAQPCPVSTIPARSLE